MARSKDTNVTARFADGETEKNVKFQPMIWEKRPTSMTLGQIIRIKVWSNFIEN